MPQKLQDNNRERKINSKKKNKDFGIYNKKYIRIQEQDKQNRNNNNNKKFNE